MEWSSETTATFLIHKPSVFMSAVRLGTESICISFLHVTYYVNICRFGGQWPICNPDSIKFPLQDCSFWYFIMGWSWFCPKKCRQESLIRAKVDAQRMQETLGAGSWALVFCDPILHLAQVWGYRNYSNPKKEAFQLENQWTTMMCPGLQLFHQPWEVASCWHPIARAC